MGKLNIITGKTGGAMKIVIYGPEGIGKSTLAARFPRPLFIDTEGGTKFMDVPRTPRPASWTALLDQVSCVWEDPSLCGTLVLDTADWAERLCAESICAQKKISSLEELGYGKGYVYLTEEFGRLLNTLGEITERGVNVVLTAHAKMRKFEQPDELGAYDRWELKLQKTAAPLVKEWADLLLFANYKTYAVAVDKEGKKHKAQGGKRVLYTTHHPCWDAKNRLGLPEELPLDYAALAPYIESTAGDGGIGIDGGRGGAEAAPYGGTTGDLAPSRERTLVGAGLCARPSEGITAPPDQRTLAGAAACRPSPDTASAGVPAVLRPLLESAGVTEAQVREIIAGKGYFPIDTPWEAMEAAGFVDGWVLPWWGQIVSMIRENSKDLPF